MKLTKTLNSLLLGFLLSILVFIGAIYFTYKSEDNLFMDFSEVEKIHHVISKTKSVTNLISKVESNVRGFGISMNEDFLVDIEKDKNEIDRNIAELKDLMSQDQLHLAKFAEFKVAVDEKLNNLSKKIELFGQKVPDKVEIEVKIKLGLILSQRINKVETELVKAEEILLVEKHNTAIKDLKKTKLTIQVIGSSALAMSIIIIIFFFEYVKTQSKAEKQLIELNENKNRFFSIISHDLRNPVKNIVLMAQLLTEEANSKSYDPIKIATMIQRSANNLSSLLDNLLKWSRLQMNKIEFIPEKLDLKKVADDIIRHQSVNAGQKNITMINQIPAGVYAFVDQNMITTAIRNIISNGIKFTNKDGIIEVSCIVNSKFVEITISDNGVGMPREIAEKLFSLDFKHTTKGTNKEEGTGLGLKLCKELIEKNNGSIKVESVLNHGSKFIINLPIAK